MKDQESKLESTDAIEPETSETVVIPPQYEGLPSEVVDSLWDETIYSDSEKTNNERERREKVLDEIRRQEQMREQQKEQAIAESYSLLSDDLKNVFREEQAKVVDELGRRLADGTYGEGLTKEERFIMSKLESEYQQTKEKQVGTITFSFDREIDRRTYDNMVNRLALESTRKRDTEENLALVRSQLGIQKPEEKVPEKKEEIREDLKDNVNQPAIDNIAAHLKKRLDDYSDERISKKSIEEQEKSRKKKASLEKNFAALLKDLEASGDKGKIASVLMNEEYLASRESDYVLAPAYREAWDYAVNDKTVPAVKQGGWIYRGIFPSKSEGIKTETRGSLNINVDTAAISELDDLIKRGIIKANYKIGDPETQASASDRHDAVTIYFLEVPSEEGLKALSDIAKRHYRADDLLGRKISDGFYMSEVGSVSDQHAADLVNLISQKDQKLGESVLGFLKNKNRIAMSEAQFYAVKKALTSYGIDISYNSDTGFTVQDKV